MRSLRQKVFSASATVYLGTNHRVEWNRAFTVIKWGWSEYYFMQHYDTMLYARCVLMKYREFSRIATAGTFASAEFHEYFELFSRYQLLDFSRNL